MPIAKAAIQRRIDCIIFTFLRMEQHACFEIMHDPFPGSGNVEATPSSLYTRIVSAVGRERDEGVACTSRAYVLLLADGI